MSSIVPVDSQLQKPPITFHYTLWLPSYDLENILTVVALLNVFTAVSTGVVEILNAVHPSVTFRSQRLVYINEMLK